MHHVGGETGKQLYTFKYIGGDNDIHLSVNSKGDQLIIVANNTLMLYNTITGEQLAKTESYPSYSDASFANDDVIIGASNGIRLLDAKTYPNAPISKAILITKQEFGCSKTKKVLLANTKGCDIIDLAAASKQQSYDYDKNFFTARLPLFRSNNCWY